MKTHRPVQTWARHRWRVFFSCRILGSTWHDRERVLERRLAKTLCDALAAGRTIIENNDTPWRLGQPCFVPHAAADPHYLGAHIARRVIGFGWSVAIKPVNR